jgi:hypothetical protein
VPGDRLSMSWERCWPRSVCDETIELLADRPDLISAVGMLRWQEWGKAPEPEDPQWWVNATGQEAGRDSLPVTYVAVSGGGEMLGAIGVR